jgi:uncharacterized iron-regulated membrane protein
MTFRKVLFWLHLIFGAIAGIVVLIMSITGIALTYQKQVTLWADKNAYQIQRAAGAAPLPVEKLVDKFFDVRPGIVPTSLSVSSDPTMPASITTAPNNPTFINPYTGEILGSGSQSVRAFFKVMTDWHRWLALSGENRKMGKSVTGACNVVFLFLAISGLYLWWPRKWTPGAFRTIAWFRIGLSSKGRDSNWHYIFGFWCLVPLMLIIISAVVISYPWASKLVFKMAGSQLSPPTGPPGPGGPGIKLSSTTPARSALHDSSPDRQQMLRQLEGLDLMLKNVQAQAGEWKTISVQLPIPKNGPVAFSVDAGMGGQPQLRSTVTLNRSTGSIIRSERFQDMDPGVRARLWMRFIHTGEYYGFAGQTLAGIASAAGAVLVWTGLALTFRRYFSWIKRRVKA